MNIEEEDKGNNLKILSIYKISQNQQDEQADTKTMANQIAITEKKKRIRAKWVPIVLKSLKSDTDPVFIYYFFRMMKNYGNEEYQKYRNFGLQDGGIGIVQQIEYDKVNQFLNLSLYTCSVGEFEFTNLISLYKSYQNQQYYDLALALEEYQVWSITNYYNFQNELKQVEQLPKEVFQQIDEELDISEQFIKQWANQNFGNDVFELVTGNIDINQKIPVLKKNMFSKNLIYLLGSNMEDMYSNMSQQKKKDFLPNFLRGGEFNGLFQLEKIIKLIKETTKGNRNYEIEDEFATLDGFCIPTKRQVKVYFYDFLTRTISLFPQLQFIIVTTFYFEPKWIKYLIEKRSEKNFNLQQYFHEQNQDIMNDFDYICQQEYFIDKFYSSQKNQQ